MTMEMLKRAVEVGGEAGIVLLFRSIASRKNIHEDVLPFDPSVDHLNCAVDPLYGRVDLVITHANGSTTLIVVKDGDRGHDHVGSGIGNVSLCATQLALVLGSSSSVRKALLWTSTGSPLLDVLIEHACVAADVIPLPWSTTAHHLAAAAKCINLDVSSATHHADVHRNARGLH